MTKPEGFARVEPFEGVTERGAGPYFKLLAANMIINEGFSFEELQEMADALNASVSLRVQEAVKEFAEEVIEDWRLGISGRDSIREMANKFRAMKEIRTPEAGK